MYFRRMSTEDIINLLSEVKSLRNKWLHSNKAEVETETSFGCVPEYLITHYYPKFEDMKYQIRKLKSIVNAEKEIRGLNLNNIPATDFLIDIIFNNDDVLYDLCYLYTFNIYCNYDSKLLRFAMTEGSEEKIYDILTGNNYFTFGDNISVSSSNRGNRRSRLGNDTITASSINTTTLWDDVRPQEYTINWSPAPIDTVHITNESIRIYDSRDADTIMSNYYQQEPVYVVHNINELTPF